jgi:hypothetical protein
MAAAEIGDARRRAADVPGIRAVVVETVNCSAECSVIIAAAGAPFSRSPKVDALQSRDDLPRVAAFPFLTHR